MGQKLFVERSFELDGAPLLARFDVPEKAATGEYRCTWSLGWPEGEEQGHACGEDGVQAMMLAMRSVHYVLADSEAYKAGRLTLWQQADLDLPPTWAAGPLYFVPPTDRQITDD